jgi:hypothetical protein
VTPFPAVDPDRAEGREWLARELAGPEYREAQGSWLARAWAWLQDWLAQVRVPGLGTNWTAVVVVVLLLAAIVTAVFLVGGPLRRSARQREPDAVFDAAPEPASTHFARADAAAAAGDWALAVAERFRGLVRSLEERTVIDSRPGRTASEIAAQAGTSLPGCADALARAARTFDDVRYGGRPASAAGDEDLRGVVRAVAAARPVLGPAVTS